MIFFKNDYGAGAHPHVFQALAEHNLMPADSYSHDEYSVAVTEMIRALTGQAEAHVHFIAGGTLTNLVCLAAFLRPYEAVIAADSAHICVHETGAIEATGHKILSVPAVDGKVLPAEIDKVVAFHETDQMVLPKVVYISDTTEMGAVYTKAELQALRACCDAHGLYLYIDGARLAMALGSEYNDLSLQDIASLADAFYVGGTKCGALFGEMVVILNEALKPYFRFIMRQHGALFAKGMLLGLQFKALLQDDLYTRLGSMADAWGQKLAAGLKAKGYSFAYTPVSNMIFPIVTTAQAEALAEHVLFEKWLDNPDGTQTIRLVTSWMTKQEDIDGLLQYM